jgi:hypothetical protein
VLAVKEKSTMGMANYIKGKLGMVREMVKELSKI